MIMNSIHKMFESGSNMNNLKYVVNKTYLRQRTEQNVLTDRNRPTTTDLRHSSLAANNITAKLTNQSVRTGLRTFDRQQLFTWLRWWLPVMLSIDQSPLPTTVLLGTALIWMIRLYYQRSRWLLCYGGLHRNVQFELTFSQFFQLVNSILFNPTNKLAFRKLRAYTNEVKMSIRNSYVFILELNFGDL